MTATVSGTTVETLPPCPKWCRLYEHGHRYITSTPAGVTVREHQPDIWMGGLPAKREGGVWLSVFGEERRSPTGRRRFSPLSLRLWAVRPAEHTPQQARELAAELIRMADQMDEFGGQR